MEQISNNTENNMTDKIIEIVNHSGNNVQVSHEAVNHIDNTTNIENDVQVNHEAVNHIENTTNH